MRRRTDWLSDIDKAVKEAQNKRIFEMWLACHTQEEIAEAENISEGTIANRVSDFLNFGQVSKNEKNIAEHNIDFEAPLYNPGITGGLGEYKRFRD